MTTVHQYKENKCNVELQIVKLSIFVTDEPSPSPPPSPPQPPSVMVIFSVSLVFSAMLSFMMIVLLLFWIKKVQYLYTTCVFVLQ